MDWQALANDRCKNMSGWFLFNVNSNLSSIWWREQAKFQWDDDEIRFVLDQQSFSHLLQTSGTILILVYDNHQLLKNSNVC
jgi:hypothetical protein